MAQRVETRLVDDLDGSEAVETIHFSWRGISYSIDLNETHIKAFEESVIDFVDAARVVKASRKVSQVRRGGTRAVVSREQSQAVRDWANANGFSVAARGRVPAKAVAAFEAAHQS